MAAWNNLPSEMMQVDSNTGDSAPDDNEIGPMDYKTMLVVLKTLCKDSDAMLDKIGTMNAKFASQLTKLTAAIDPEVNAIMYKKSKDTPDFSLSQQRALNLTSEEIDKQFIEMCDFLDQRVAETYGNQ